MIRSSPHEIDPGREQSRHLLEIARRAALAVRDPLLSGFRSAMTIDTKVDRHDIVTEHDRRSEAMIRDLIFREAPDSIVLGEEDGRVGEGSVHWYVDPIDGTANFARGIAFWCVSIGAVMDGRIVAGVIYDPVADNLFEADLTGVTLNGKPIVSSAIPDETRATLLTGYPVARDFRLDGHDRALGHFGTLAETFSTLRRPGSAALSIAHVAAGWADAAVGFGVNPWDVTAAVLILRQAKGSYLPLTLGKVSTGTPDHLCPGYIAIGDGGHYPTLLRVVEAISHGRETHVGQS